MQPYHAWREGSRRGVGLAWGAGSRWGRVPLGNQSVVDRDGRWISVTVLGERG
jgi:hypothetical protein